MCNEPTICESGRRLGFGGRWTTPCSEHAIHGICCPEAEPMYLCDKHFQEVLSAGLISKPNISKEAFDMVELQRKGKWNHRESPDAI